MRYDSKNRTLYVSRRNLRALLAKLDANKEAGEAISACTIGDPDCTIWITAEEDVHHYDPERRRKLGHAPTPGPMHPREEAKLR